MRINRTVSFWSFALVVPLDISELLDRPIAERELRRVEYEFATSAVTVPPEWRGAWIAMSGTQFCARPSLRIDATDFNFISGGVTFTPGDSLKDEFGIVIVPGTRNYWTCSMCEKQEAEDAVIFFSLAGNQRRVLFQYELYPKCPRS